MSRSVANVFGGVLREARHTAGITQEDLAERADVDRTYPSLLERGLRQPTLTTLLALAKALGTEPETLITRLRAQLNERQFQR